MTETLPALLSAVVTATPEIAALVDAAGDVTWVNPAFVTRWPCAQTPTVGGLLDVVDPGDHEAIEAAWERVRSGGPRTVVQRARLGCSHTRREGRVRLTRVETGDADGSVVIHIEQMDGATLPHAGLDTLTGLADRAGLLAQLDAVLAEGRPAHLALIDLDGFHLVNESLGHAAGDDVLVTVARRLRAAAHPEDVLARLTGDEFAVVCPHGEECHPLLQDLRARIHEPVGLGDAQHVLDSSVGLVDLRIVSGTVEALAAASSALYLATSRGPGRIEVFDAGLRDTALTTLRRTSELQHAVRRDELVLRYQPIVDLATGRTVGCEALLRWVHPLLGEVGPADFLEVAETSGILDDLTGKLLADACRAACTLSLRGRETYVSVNLSPRQLLHPRLLDLVDLAIEGAGIAPAQLMVEITETAMLHDVAAAVAVLTALRQRGVLVALDDFGTGFSSLLRLRELPVDRLKIDRTFISGLSRGSDDLAIVAGVLGMAAGLELGCIAEGVESEEQARSLRRLGCHHAQGYRWSPAVPLEDVLLDFGTGGPAWPSALV